jgi:hypothetical protein
MEILGMEVPKEKNDNHEVTLDDVPTLLEESPGVAVRTGSFIGRHLIDGALNLRLGNGITKNMQVHERKIKLIPIEIMHTSDPSLQNGFEVVGYNILFRGMLGDPPLIVLETMNVAFFCLRAFTLK